MRSDYCDGYTGVNDDLALLLRMTDEIFCHFIPRASPARRDALNRYFTHVQSALELISKGMSMPLFSFSLVTHNEHGAERRRLNFSSDGLCLTLSGEKHYDGLGFVDDDGFPWSCSPLKTREDDSPLPIGIRDIQEFLHSGAVLQLELQVDYY